jgi:hypothetical protein
LLSALAACSSGSGVSGRYKNDTEGTIELKSDGSFVLEQPAGERVTGAYEVSESTITFKLPDGSEGKGTMEGDRLRDPDGKVPYGRVRSGRASALRF